MIFRNHKQAVLSVLIATAIGGVVVTDAVAQSRSSDRSADRRGGKKDQAKAEALYPQATRAEPDIKASPKLGKQLQKMIDSYNDQKFPRRWPRPTRSWATAPPMRTTSRWPRSWPRRLPTTPTTTLPPRNTCSRCWNSTAWTTTATSSRC